MHEYAVTQSMIAMAVEEANKAEASRIIEIRLVIGDLSTIIDDSVQMYFDIMSEGTLAEGAKLVFNRVKAEFKCKTCGEVLSSQLRALIVRNAVNWALQLVWVENFILIV